MSQRPQWAIVQSAPAGYRVGSTSSFLPNLTKPQPKRIADQAPISSIACDDPGKTGGRKEQLPDGVRFRAVVREVKGETGCGVEVAAVVGTYTNPRYVMAIADGEARQRILHASLPDCLGS